MISEIIFYNLNFKNWKKYYLYLFNIYFKDIYVFNFNSLKIWN